jgi:hypothetical protein
MKMRFALSRLPARCWESPYFFIPPSPAVKIRAIRHYAKRFQLSTFVETGTYLGDTVAAVVDQFANCVTIELSVDLHALASARFASTRNITCLCGDSGNLLSQVISTLDEPALFWLDAHTSGQGTLGVGYDPIHDELRQIYGHRCKRHVILIDDARGHPVDAIVAAVPDSHTVSVRNDIIRITPTL